ncbi:polyisoprenoid diphosphate/phosphate phosphohydrolase PLPP6-like [Mya arenaria]|uniref:polyisoprenoid diphosphate/phosphate phosphohydrolase PLPP6-like n=1 Tax=Mya arenaria TaxID=6604 RepID=UPI0022E509CA|nr:polyisoprenoid diphosphate/phosphate phosphohydrolase PLPP6-like [Mya arenaria]
MSTSRIRTKGKDSGKANGHIGGKSKKRKSANDSSSFLATILQLDEKYTSICAICANKDSPLSLLRPVMKLLEISCHGIPWLTGTVLLILSVHLAHHVEMSVNLLFGLILDLIVIGILKVAFRRSRPKHNEMDMFATVSIDNYSFPSGHASRAGMLACFFLIEYLSCPTKELLILAWSFTVTISRVVLGRHHLIDVVCGYGVGILEYLMLVYLWIPQKTCMSWLELYFSHFHL